MPTYPSTATNSCRTTRTWTRRGTRRREWDAWDQRLGTSPRENTHTVCMGRMGTSHGTERRVHPATREHTHHTTRMRTCVHHARKHTQHAHMQLRTHAPARCAPCIMRDLQISRTHTHAHPREPAPDHPPIARTCRSAVEDDLAAGECPQNVQVRNRGQEVEVGAGLPGNARPATLSHARACRSAG
jgi:hypothetical protein